MHQNLQKSMAVLDGSMALMNPATLRQQLSELRAFEAKVGPGRLRMGASPCLLGKALRQAFAERAVESSIVGDYQMGELKECFDSIQIDHLAFHHAGYGPDEAQEPLPVIPAKAGIHIR